MIKIRLTKPPSSLLIRSFAWLKRNMEITRKTIWKTNLWKFFRWTPIWYILIVHWIFSSLLLRSLMKISMMIKTFWLLTPKRILIKTSSLLLQTILRNAIAEILSVSSFTASVSEEERLARIVIVVDVRIILIALLDKREWRYYKWVTKKCSTIQVLQQV